MIPGMPSLPRRRTGRKANAGKEDAPKYRTQVVDGVSADASDVHNDFPASEALKRPMVVATAYASRQITMASRQCALSSPGAINPDKPVSVAGPGEAVVDDG